MIDNSNLLLINSFITGMNLDSSDLYIQPTSYREAYNLRLTTGINNNTGSLHNIEGVKFFLNIETLLPTLPTGLTYTDVEVIHTDSIRKYGVVFVKAKVNNISYYYIFRFINKDELVGTETGLPKLIFGPCSTLLGNNLSTVTKWEDSDNIKVYYADSINPLRSINIAPALDATRVMTDDGSFTIYPTALLTKPKFLGFGSGGLKVGSYLYGYQLFNKNGAETEISPLTEIISTIPSSISPSTTKEVIGGVKDEISNKSIQLSIEILDTTYDRIKIVSVFYEDSTALPLIQVIRDTKLAKNADNIIQFVITDNNGLSTLTLEEFNLITSIHFSPSIIETKNNVLFASDILYNDNIFDVEYDARAYAGGFDSTDKLIAVFKNSNNDTVQSYAMDDILTGKVVIDKEADCINPYSIINNNNSSYFVKAEAGANLNNLKCAFRRDTTTSTDMYGGEGINVSYKFIVTELDNSSLSKRFEGVWYSNILRNGTNTDTRFLRLSPTVKSGLCNYSNPLIASYVKSLQRDEVYRYSIIFYNKFNLATPAKWIADIRTPSVYDLGFESFRVGANVSFLDDKSDLLLSESIVRPLGIEFQVKHIPADAYSYEIVRCKREESDRATITQGVISNAVRVRDEKGNYADEYYPSIYLTSSLGFFSSDISSSHEYNQSGLPDFKGYSRKYKLTDGKLPIPSDRDEYIFKGHSSLVNIFTSPEICYNYEGMKGVFPKTGIRTEMIKYVFPWIDDSNVPDSDLRIMNGKLAKYVIEGVAGDSSTKYIPFYQYRTNINYGGNYWNQSNYCQTLPAISGGPLSEATTSAGASSDIKDVDFPKEGSWKDFSSRMDFISGIDGKTFNNWTCERIAKDAPAGNMGVHGRSIILSKANPINYNLDNYPINLLFLGDYESGATIVSKSKLESRPSSFVNSNISYVKNTNNFYNNSVLGLALCNIRKNTIPYGGYGYQERTLSTYMSVGGYNARTKSQLQLFGGDTYIGSFLYTNTHYFKGILTDGTLTKDNAHYTYYWFPVESSINLNYTNARPGNSIYELLQPANVDGKYIQDKPLYVYNPIYSVLPNARVFTPLNLYDEYNKHVDVRTYYSLSKNNDEFVDLWTKFKPLNYLDVDTRYGALTNLRTFGNELIFWLLNAVGKYSVNERTLITDDSNSPLILGTGGTLSRYDYLATLNGLKKGHMDSDCQSDNVLYWYDYDKHELCLYSGGNVVCLSKAKYVLSYLNNLSLTKVEQVLKPMLTFDKYYNEMIATLAKNESLVYNEALQMFTGFYNIVPDYNIYFNSNVYFIKDKKLYQYNLDTTNTGFNDTKLPIELNYIINKDYLHTKVYDNIEFTGYLLKDNISFDFISDDTVSKTLVGTQISNREYDYRAAIPRHNTTELFGNRLRGRVMYCKMKYNLFNTGGAGITTITEGLLIQTILESKNVITNNNSNVDAQRFELPYIRTTYRISKN